MKPTKPLLIIIRGAPSTGKTTIAYLLSQKLPNAVLISIDCLVQMNTPLKHSDSEWVKARPLGHKLARILTQSLLEEEKNVVLEEAFPFRGEIERFEEINKNLVGKSFIFELTVPLDIALKREENRPFARKGKPVKEIMEIIADNPYPGAIKIDTSQKSPAETVKNILDIVSPKRLSQSHTSNPR